MIMDSTE